MPRFFVDGGQIANDEICIRGDDAYHIARSLRMAVGEGVTVCDMSGCEYECTLTKINDDCVIAAVNSKTVCKCEPPHKIFVYQALPKSDKLELIIQKCVELGVFEIVPFESSRCIAKTKDTDGKKQSRRNKIAAEAAKQCGRGIIPFVRETLPFEDAIARAAECDLPLFCYEGERDNSLRKIICAARETLKNIESVSIVVGSEGGFSASEAEYAVQAGLKTVGLGKRILRCETAAPFVLSALEYEFEL